MAQLVVRDIEDDVKERLRHRARRHGRIMEEEIREILRDAAKASDDDPTRLGTRIAARFSAIGLDGDLPKLPRQKPKAARFGQ